MVTTEIGEVLEVAEREGYMPDFVGLANRVGKIKQVPGRSYVGLVALFATRNEQMWHDVWNADPKRQDPRHLGRQTLFLDAAHEQINPNISVLDSLYVFKEYMRKWAARNHDWYSMQDGLAKQIVGYEEGLTKGGVIAR